MFLQVIEEYSIFNIRKKKNKIISITNCSLIKLNKKIYIQVKKKKKKKVKKNV
jgi:hypothetical protein